MDYNQIIIISGERGCGKTTHAQKIKEHFQAKRIVDGWWPGMKLEPGDLALTTFVPQPNQVNSLPGAIYTWSDLKRKGVV